MLRGNLIGSGHLSRRQLPIDSVIRLRLE